MVAANGFPPKSHAECFRLSGGERGVLWQLRLLFKMTIPGTTCTSIYLLEFREHYYTLNK